MNKKLIESQEDRVTILGDLGEVIYIKSIIR